MANRRMAPPEPRALDNPAADDLTRAINSGALYAKMPLPTAPK